MSVVREHPNSKNSTNTVTRSMTTFLNPSLETGFVWCSLVVVVFVHNGARTDRRVAQFL